MLTAMQPRVVTATARDRRSARRRGLAIAPLVLAPEPVARGVRRRRRRSGKKPDSQPIAGGTKLAALWPLTGEPVTGATPDRPVLVTKIDNSPSSQPQLGLKKADLVTEELVEGGMTRLAVFFYQHLPDVVGPVRSMRASDIGIVKPAHGVIVASGAAAAHARAARRARTSPTSPRAAPATSARAAAARRTT